MRWIDYLATAWRNVRRQKLRSSLTILAVVIGATSVTAMLAIVTSAKSFMYDQYKANGVLQQVVVTRDPGLDYDQARFGGNNSDVGPKLSDALAARIATMAHVKGVARTAQPYVFDHLSLGTKTVSVQNVRADEANGVIVHSLVAGRDFVAGDRKGLVLLSKGYADKLGFAARYTALVGQQITLITQPFYSGPGATITPPPQQQGPGQPSPSQNGPQPQQPTQFVATVVGITADDDSEVLYVPFAWAGALLTSRHYDMHGAPGTQPTPTLVTESDLARRGYSTLTVEADALANVDAVAASIKTTGAGASTAKSYVSGQLQMFDIIGYVLGGIGAIALAVAALGVINTMIMAILERTRQIGIMRACGATRRAVRRLFTLEAAFLGFCGGIVGIVAGFGLTRVANVVVNQQLARNAIRARDIIGIPPWLILTVISTTTALGMLAGLYPAHRAARLDPVEALRYE